LPSAAENRRFSLFRTPPLGYGRRAVRGLVEKANTRDGLYTHDWFLRAPLANTNGLPGLERTADRQLSKDAKSNT